MKQCNHCGAFIDDNAQFCTSCGTPCNQTIMGNSPSCKDYHMWCYIGGGILAVVIAVLAGVFFYNNKTETIPSPTETIAPVSESFQNEVNSVDDGVAEENVETSSEYYNGYEIKFSDAVKAFYEDGLWGLKNYYGDVILTPRYKEITYERPIAIGLFHNGKYDLIEGGRILFETPIDSYSKDNDIIDVVIGNQRYLYFLSTMYKAGPIKEWRRYWDHNSHVMCRLSNDDLLICNDMGSNRVNIVHPVYITNDEDDEHFIVYREDENHYLLYPTKGFSNPRISVSRWYQIEANYLQRSSETSVFFDVIYTYNKKISDILKEINQ